MDLLLVIGLMYYIGYINCDKSVEPVKFVSQVKKSEVNPTGDSKRHEIPVGNNLMLKREADAFTKILKELGLV